MKEQISELMDGELDGRVADSTIDALRRAGEALDAWRMYHVISDAMRDTPLLSEGFSARLAARLAAEPTLAAPRRIVPRPRFALAAAASVAAVALVGWLAFAPPPPTPAAPTPVAAAAPKATVVTVTTVLPNAANDYLLAHQGFSPRVYLQGMAPYVRTVSEPADEPAR
jgi:sigma-E factor negative regulatory protein RseA